MRKSSRPGTPSRRQVQFTLAVVAAATVGTATLSSAAVPPPTTRPADWNNAGGDNAYVNGANWNPAITGSPTNANNEFLTINNGGTAVISAGDAAEGAFLNLGLRPGDTGSLQITGGTLTVGELRVGGRDTSANDLGGDWLAGGFSPNGGGTGSVVQSGSSVVNVTFTHGTNPDTGANYEPPAQSTYIGDASLPSGNTANGSYTIKDNATLLNGIAANDQLVIGTGAGTHGTFLQQDNSTVTSTGYVIVGRQGATASYTLTGGSLNAQGNNGLWVADGASPDGTTVVPGTTATFTQSGGTVTLANALEVGRRGGTGTYVMSGGTLTTGAELRVGSNGNSSEAGVQSGVGTFSLSGGTITVGTNLHVGIAGSATANTVAGTFTQTGGSISMPLSNAVFAIGNGLLTSGTYDISAGSLTETGSSALFHIGRNNGSGIVKISGTANVNVNELRLDSSNTAGAVRELDINGGSLTVGNWEQGSGNTAAVRTVNQTGGTLSVTSTTFAHRAGRSVTYNFSGGTTSFAGAIPLDTSIINVSNTANVTFNNIRTGGAASGSATTGTINVSGGSFTAANVNDSGAAGGTVNVSGGTVSVPGTWNVTNASPSGSVGSLNITNGNVSINNLVTYGNAPGSPVAGTVLYIAGGNVAINNLTLSSTTTLKTDNTISLNSAVNVGNATVNVNSGSLSLTGSLNDSSRTLTKTGPGTLTISGTQTHAGTATLTNNAGILNLNSNANGNLTVNANSTTNFGASQSLKTLNVASGVTATLVADGNRTLTTSTLNLNASAGTLDLTNNTLAIPYTAPNSPAATVVGYLHSAYAGGAWSGAGLTSSTAKNRGDHATGLGWSDSANQVTVTYTWMGDLNLDKKIDGDDYALIDREVAKFGLGAAGGWKDGDVNYDGVVNVADYAVMDAAFGHQNNGLSPEFLADREARFGAAYVADLVTAVPEPTTLGLLAAAAGVALSRRTRRRAR